MTYESLFEEAKRAKMLAYVPYSKFAVGAALMTEDGRIFHGCNIENASYSLGNCGERTAFFKAVSEGRTDFSTLAVVAESKRPVPPCGACRQVMAEFCSPDMPVILFNMNGEMEKTTVAGLLPGAFVAEDLHES